MVVAGAMSWISVVVLRLEQAEIRARAETDYEGSLQRALWRMDSWLALFLARESARPYADYLPHDSLATSRSLLRSASAGAQMPSPLLNFESEYVQLHFHTDPGSGVTSPQLPALPYDKLPESTTISPAEMETRRDAWNRLRPYLDLSRLRNGVTSAESLATTKLANAVSQGWYSTDD